MQTLRSMREIAIPVAIVLCYIAPFPRAGRLRQTVGTCWESGSWRRRGSASTGSPERPAAPSAAGLRRSHLPSPPGQGPPEVASNPAGGIVAPKDSASLGCLCVGAQPLVAQLCVSPLRSPRAAVGWRHHREGERQPVADADVRAAPRTSWGGPLSNRMSLMIARADRKTASRDKRRGRQGTFADLSRQPVRYGCPAREMPRPRNGRPRDSHCLLRTYALPPTLKASPSPQKYRSGSWTASSLRTPSNSWNTGIPRLGPAFLTTSSISSECRRFSSESRRPPGT